MNAQNIVLGEEKSDISYAFIPVPSLFFSFFSQSSIKLEN
jgi:hypothetical protein